MVKLLDELVEEILKSAPGDNKFGLTAEYLRKQITGEAYTGFLTE
jgi:hypothetical protein